MTGTQNDRKDMYDNYEKLFKIDDEKTDESANGTPENQQCPPVNTQAGPPCHVRVTHIGAWALINRPFPTIFGHPTHS